jgi:hypothetical protein
MNTANTPTPQAVDLNKRIAQYIQLRDEIKRLDDAHKEVMKPYRETLEQLNSALLNHLNALNVDSTRADAGTVYRTTKKSASVADMASFWAFVVATGQFDLIDKKANVSAVSDFIDKSVEAAKNDPTIQPGPPPGVNYTTVDVVGVRRS